MKRIACRGFFKSFCYQYSTKQSVKFDENVIKDIENAVYKPRKHPGITKTSPVSVSENIIKAMNNALQDHPVKSIIADSDTLVKYLKHRHSPLEPHELKSKMKDVEQKILEEHNSKELTSNERVELLSRYRGKMYKMLKTKLHIWKPVNYNTYACLLYMMGRSAAEYAVLIKILTELDRKFPDFKPRTYFDFGSGVGTGVWAVRSFWEKYLFEYFCVDASSEMQDLLDILLRDGVGNKSNSVKGLFQRQFLPASKNMHDIVLSSYSLSELPSSKHRLETVLNLWNKTEHFLIIVELGNNVGFKIVNEARDFILDIEDENNIGHVIAPCPHDQACPRLSTDRTPCNFEVNYLPLPFGNRHGVYTERFSYIVMKKGKRKGTDIEWPRLVRPTLVRSRHTICRLCTAAGKLEEIVFTASKYGKLQYHCARASKWGDSLPVKLYSEDTSLE